MLLALHCNKKIQKKKDEYYFNMLKKKNKPETMKKILQARISSNLLYLLLTIDVSLSAN